MNDNVRPDALTPWSVRAVNLPEHADNPVHTDEGARAAGHPRALVAGTTVYAYLTHPPAVRWGVDWIEGGGGEVRFRSPVFDGDTVVCTPVASGSGDVRIEARVDEAVRATFDAVRTGAQPAPLVGEPLPRMEIRLDDDVAGYGGRTGDDLSIYADHGLTHPAAWTIIGNRVTMANYVDGPWIHVRSRVAHLGRAPYGAPAVVASTLIERFDSRAGQRVVLDVRVSVDDRPVAAIEHESVIRLAASPSG